MQQPTQRLMPVVQDERRSATVTAIASALVGFGVAYLLLLTQPALAAKATAFVREELLPASADWLAPITVAGFAIGASGLGIYALRGFVLGVRRAPYLSLAPLLAVLSGVVLLGGRAQLPVEGTNTIAFAVPALLLALGGGALLQARGRLLKLTGAALWLTPMVLLGLAYLSRAQGVASAIVLTPGEQLFVFMVGATWLALLAIAFVAPDPAGQQAQAQSNKVIEELRANLSEAESRASGNVRELHDLASEKLRLQRELELLERRAGAAAMGKGGGIGMWPLLAAGSVVIAGFGAVTHFGVQRPLQVKLNAARAVIADSDRAHASTLDALKSQLSTEQAELERARAELAGALEDKGKHDEALAACQAQLPTEEEAAAEAEAQAAPAVAAKPKPKAKAKPKARASKRKARKPRAPEVDSLIAGGDDPIAGLE